MTQEAKTTTDHEEIRAWVAARDRVSATVASTGEDNEPGVLEILFQAQQSGDALEDISWDDFFKKFEEDKLAFLYQSETRRAKPVFQVRTSLAITASPSLT